LIADANAFRLFVAGVMVYVEVPTVKVKELAELILWLVGSVTDVAVLSALEVEPGTRTSME
jgi:hypothetical protein